MALFFLKDEIYPRNKIYRAEGNFEILLLLRVHIGSLAQYGSPTGTVVWSLCKDVWDASIIRLL